LASRQGFGQLKTEQLGGHSQEQQRHRQALIDDDDDDCCSSLASLIATTELQATGFQATLGKCPPLNFHIFGEFCKIS